MALADKRLFLLDMDGTLYLDDRLFDKVPEFLSHVRRGHGGGHRPIRHPSHVDLF